MHTIRLSYYSRSFEVGLALGRKLTVSVVLSCGTGFNKRKSGHLKLFNAHEYEYPRFCLYVVVTAVAVFTLNICELLLSCSQ